tara:strand:+ start:9241 stop:9357 length:117 start_codon:yes stop_codon:yes gene_type:complete
MSKKDNKKATNMAKAFFASGLSFDKFLKEAGYIEKKIR